MPADDALAPLECNYFAQKCIVNSICDPKIDHVALYLSIPDDDPLKSVPLFDEIDISAFRMFQVTAAKTYTNDNPENEYLRWLGLSNEYRDSFYQRLCTQADERQKEVAENILYGKYHRYRNVKVDVNDVEGQLKLIFSPEVIQEVKDEEQAKISSFYVYMEHMRPVLLAEGLVLKHYFQLNLILRNRFYKLSAEDLQKLDKIARRIRACHQKIKETPIEYAAIVEEDIQYRLQRYSHFPHEDLKMDDRYYRIIAERNKMRVLIHFPDLYHYYAWIPSARFLNKPVPSMSDFEGYSVFVAEKFHLLRQLKPFTFADDATLSKILECAWKKLSDNDKAYYVKKTSEQGDNADDLTNLAKKKMEENKPPSQGELDPREIYLKEMRLIVLQDLSFVRNNFDQMSEILERGWGKLNDAQRLVFYEKMVQPSKKAELPNTIEQKTHWGRHTWRYLTNETDSLAFCGYANTVLEEKRTIKPLYTGDWEQQQELKQTWKILDDKVKQYYTGIAYQNRLKYETDPKNRFIGFYNNPTYLSKVTTIDDINSELTPILPFKYIHVDNDMSAFLIFMEMSRPELLKDPEVAKKRFWDVNMILNDKWASEMSQEDKQKYHDIARRCIEIKSKLHEWQLDAKDVYTYEQKSKKSYFYASTEMWSKVDVEEKKKCAETAIENRKVLLKKYPDFYQFYTWTRCDDIPVDSKKDQSAEASAVEPLNAVEKEWQEALLQLDITIAASEKKDIVPYNQNFYGDAVDVKAFTQYVRDVESMSSEILDCSVLWRQFIRLSDKERAVYYDEHQKQQLSMEARKLFAKDNCSIEKTLENEQEYADQQKVLFKKWEKLSPHAKQYYLDIAEKKLLERKKEHPDDIQFTPPTISYVKTKDAVDNLNASLAYVYPYKFHGKCMSEIRKASMVYTRKHFPELLKEPGMAEKRYFQLKLILERRFMNLSDEERKPYVDLVQRIMEIYNHIEMFPVCLQSVIFQKFRRPKYMKKLSYHERFVCTEMAKENRKMLLEKFPDVDEHFRWTTYREQVKVTDNSTETSDAKECVINDETPKEVQEEVCHDVSPKSEVPETQKGDFAENNADNDAKESVDTGAETSKTQESTSTNETAQRGTGGSSENSKLVTAEDGLQEEASSECDNANANSASDNHQEVVAEDKANAKKAPTAFMFYKKAVRRHFGKDYGKDPAQREKLILDWKNLSDKAKAFYFEQKRLACLKLQQK